ncbi:MAG: SDR family NAD(P)-dependent oxidoreductase, partial [Pseudomonadota bacterium]
MDGLGDLSGKHVLVTGATTGIGAHVARALATGGARLWVHGRDPARTAAAAAAAGPGAVPVVADFERLRDVRALAARMAEETDRLDVLVNNAGLIRDRLVITEDGVESTFGVNHLAPFVLTLSLLSLLQASPAARIVTVASRAHRQSKRFDVDDLVRPSCYETLEAYARSKTCNILFTRELARRLAATPTTANCVHPGFVASRFGR